MQIRGVALGYLPRENRERARRVSITGLVRRMQFGRAALSSARRDLSMALPSRMRRAEDSIALPALRQNRFHHLRLRIHARELHVRAQPLHRELAMVDAEQMQNGRVQIANMHRVLDDLVAE